MQYINATPNLGGSYPPLQPIPAPGLLFFPDEFLSVFYPEDKQAAGFVTIQHENGIVTDCQWNEEAYQAYLAALPEPEDPPEALETPDTLEARVSAVEAETAALTAAIERGLAL